MSTAQLTPARVRRRTTAQGMVEFALVLPLFLLILGGLVEGGRLLYAYNTVNHAAQEAGRVASIRETVGVTAVQAEAVDAAQPLTVSAANVTVAVNGGATTFIDRKIGDRVKVSVGYQFVPIVSLAFGSRAGISLNGSSEAMVE